LISALVLEYEKVELQRDALFAENSVLREYIWNSSIEADAGCGATPRRENSSPSRLMLWRDVPEEPEAPERPLSAAPVKPSDSFGIALCKENVQKASTEQCNVSSAAMAPSSKDTEGTLAGESAALAPQLGLAETAASSSKDILTEQLSGTCSTEGGNSSVASTTQSPQDVKDNPHKRTGTRRLCRVHFNSLDLTGTRAEEAIQKWEESRLAGDAEKSTETDSPKFRTATMPSLCSFPSVPGPLCRKGLRRWRSCSPQGERLCVSREAS